MLAKQSYGGLTRKLDRSEGDTQRHYARSVTVAAPSSWTTPSVVFKDLARDGETPRVGPGGLHVRAGHDVDAINDDELVYPGGGGMSVTPDDVLLLPQSRRPRSLGGTGRKPIWSLSTDLLSKHSLGCRQDDVSHALVEVSEPMPLAKFNANIGDTAPDWEVVHE